MLGFFQDEGDSLCGVILGMLVKQISQILVGVRGFACLPFHQLKLLINSASHFNTIIKPSKLLNLVDVPPSSLFFSSKII
jgi:hypothetical protein